MSYVPFVLNPYVAFVGDSRAHANFDFSLM